MVSKVTQLYPDNAEDMLELLDTIKQKVADGDVKNIAVILDMKGGDVGFSYTRDNNAGLYKGAFQLMQLMSADNEIEIRS